MSIVASSDALVREGKAAGIDDIRVALKFDKWFQRATSQQSYCEVTCADYQVVA